MTKNDQVYHYVYITRNTITGELYCGKHSTKDLKKLYWGSGAKVKAWRKAGVPMVKEIISYFPTEDMALKAEENLIRQLLRCDTRCVNGKRYNPGNRFGDREAVAQLWTEEARAKQSAIRIGSTRTDETKALLSTHCRRRWSDPTERAKLSAAQLGNTNRLDKPHTPEVRARIAASVRAYWAAKRKATTTPSPAPSPTN